MPQCTTHGCDREGTEPVAFPMHVAAVYYVGLYCPSHAADVGEMRGARPAQLCPALLQGIPTPEA